MQWLMNFRLLRGILKSFHGFHPAPQRLCRRFLSGPGDPSWNDYVRPKEFNFASDVVDYWAQMEMEGKRGPNPALWWVNNQGDELKWSFREITELTCRTANVLTQTCGLQEGDYLALILPRVPEWWLVAIGCIRTGIIFMPGTIQMTTKDILYRLQVSKAKGIVTTDTLAPVVDSLASEYPGLKTKLLVSDQSCKGWLDFRSLIKSASPDHVCIKSKTLDPMAVFFTSGTSGLPKMTKHSHGLALRSVLPSCRKFLKLKTSDVFWCPSDTGWIMSMVGSLLEPWTAGSTVFVHHLTQFDPKDMIQTLFKYPITYFLAAPSVFRMILQQNPTSLRFPTLEHCCTGGEALLPEEQEQWRKQTGILLYQAYGQSETGVTCGIFRGMKIKPGSMGKAIPPFDIQIIDDKGNILPPDTEGNLGIRIKPVKPLGLFMCYENDPVKTAEVECGDFYNTGDRATIDAEGYFFFLGRADDVINASGYRIGPSEVENALAEHPAVAESAVVRSPDPIRGEVVKAFIVLTPKFLSHDRDQLTKELQQHVKSVTAPYKYPRKVEFVPELPKTITGKIKRSELRKKEFGQM
ncbi:acyl-coenzyme A synthetase ACSM1, mitochondrial [Vicugna pacos]|uniref:medium-chain acyl-CoA ligase n=1 Tax=Vicugna pacos TaxID=30538 RepID=A0A6I9IJR2_VICPA